MGCAEALNYRKWDILYINIYPIILSVMRIKMYTFPREFLLVNLYILCRELG